MTTSFFLKLLRIILIVFFIGIFLSLYNWVVYAMYSTLAVVHMDPIDAGLSFLSTGTLTLALLATTLRSIKYFEDLDAHIGNPSSSRKQHSKGEPHA